MNLRNMIDTLEAIVESTVTLEGTHTGGKVEKTEKGVKHKSKSTVDSEREAVAGERSDLDKDAESKDKDDEKKEPVKKGRGRPKKGSDSETGEVKKYDTSDLNKIFGGSMPKDTKKLDKLPKKKNKLKDWMEHVEGMMIAEAAPTAPVPGQKPAQPAQGQAAQPAQGQAAQPAQGQAAQQEVEKLSQAQLMKIAASMGIPQASQAQFAQGGLEALKKMIASNPTLQSAMAKAKSQAAQPGQAAQPVKPAVSESISESRDDKSPFERVCARFPHEHKMAQEGWGIPDSFYQALAENYFEEGRIPRDVWHGPEDELRNHVEECYAEDTLPVDEGMMGSIAGGAAGAALTKTPAGAMMGAELGGDLQDHFMEDDMEDEVDEAGIPGNVPAEQIPGKEDLLKGRGRQTYEDTSMDLEEESLAQELSSLARRSTKKSRAELDETSMEEDMNEEKWIKGAIKKPGSFTAAAKRHGETSAEFARDVVAHPEKFSKKTEKRAHLAQTLGKLHEESDEVMEAWERELHSIIKEDATLAVAPSQVQPAPQAGGLDSLIKELLKRAGLEGDNAEAEVEVDVEEPQGTDPHNNFADGHSEVPIMAMPRGMNLSKNPTTEPIVAVIEPTDSDVVIRDLSNVDHHEVAPEGSAQGDDAMNFLKRMLGQSIGTADYEEEAIDEVDQSNIPACNSSSPLTDNHPQEEVDEGDTMSGSTEEVNKQDESEGYLSEGEYVRVIPLVKRIASERSDYDRDEFGEELSSLLDQKYDSEFAKSVLNDLDFYWNTYTKLTSDSDDDNQEPPVEEEALDQPATMEAMCNECGLTESDCKCSVNESYTGLFSRLLTVFEGVEDKEKSKENDEGEECPACECSPCECDDEEAKDKVDEALANSGKNTVTADPDYMINTITAGLNSRKRNQTTVPQTEVEPAPTKNKVTNVSESAEDRYSYTNELKALAGINYNFTGQKDVSALNGAEEMRKLAGIKRF